MLSAKGATEREIFAQIRSAIETSWQNKLCTLIATAALARQESRGGFFGGHYRTDYPKLDNENWLKNIVLKPKNGSINVSYEPPVTLESLEARSSC
jgi:succinate dehydrogenase/fumarate reductase flavoprotein subunit